jgi:hypothetical protein
MHPKHPSDLLSRAGTELEPVAEAELETLLTEHEYSGLTKRSVASARRDRLLGKGCPYVKLGALVRYRPQDVKAHLAHNLRPTTAWNRDKGSGR